MTLRHRVGKGIGGSKWVKRVLARGGGGGGAMMEAGGGGGSGTKAALLETLRRSEELAARMRGAKAAAAADAADADNDVDYDSADDAPTVLRKARDRLQQEAADAAGEWALSTRNRLRFT
jgi:U3 small nucleolar RNA-associated protein 14